MGSLMKFEGHDNDLVQQSIHHINYPNNQIRDVEKMDMRIVSENNDARPIMSMTGFDYLGTLRLRLMTLRNFQFSRKYC